MVNGRYQLEDAIGQGGMGIVYRATDRLTGNVVALKRVFATPKQSQATQQDYRLALAREFQLLASLRHPHIVSVLDYGFDDTQQPYFTMKYLADAQTILEAGANQSFAYKIDLIQQLLQALTYLHRRKILHHDLKPQNILVTEGQLRVLDFGLASTDTGTFMGSSSGGTPFYVPPEIWDGQPYSEAADLYAVGVLAYQLLADVHPFAPMDGGFFGRLLDTEPDLSRLGEHYAVNDVIKRLLAKTPAARYESAVATLTALSQALQQPQPPETAAIRESYLQAAEFVGREAELAQLQQALSDAKGGKGSLWLIGGESGVGKSRLLNELRILALVDGFQVVRGQAVAEGGTAYHIWRELIGHLALHTPLTELEIGILKEISPSLEQIVGRPIADVPHLERGGAQQRLVYTVAQLLQRQTQPTVLLLEDMQWAYESFDPVIQLLPTLAEHPLLIIVSYRSDERPAILDTIGQDANVIELDRLNQAGVELLMEAMLGQTEADGDLAARLFVETEGNVFFVVETLRAWMEEAGGLWRMGETAVSQHVLTGGMQQLLRRRLDKVPNEYQPLLKLAAIAGKQLDLALLAHLGPDIDLQAWLLAGSEAMVLAVQDREWRFTHDKLRETLVHDLPLEEKRAGHERVALALEAVYEETDKLAPTLAKHWRQVSNPVKEIHYTTIACDQLIWSGKYKEAASILKALWSKYQSQLEELSELKILKLLGLALTAINKYPEAKAAFNSALVIAHSQNVQKEILELSVSLGEAIWGELQYQGRLDDAAEIAKADAYFQTAMTIAQQLDDAMGMADCWHNLGVLAAAHYHNYEQALQRIKRALTFYEQAENATDKVITTMSNLAFTLIHRDNAAEAKPYLLKVLALIEETGNPSSLPYALEMLVQIAIFEEDWEGGALYLEQLWPFAKDLDGLFYPITNDLAAMMVFHHSDYAGAQQYNALSMPLYKQREDERAFGWCIQGATAVMSDNMLRLDKSIHAMKAERSNNLTLLAYFATLVSGRYLFHNDAYKGTLWLALAEQQLPLTSYKIERFNSHVNDVIVQLRQKFALLVNTPEAVQGALQAHSFSLAEITAGWHGTDGVDLGDGEKIIAAIEAVVVK